ncbi:hypothetical protein OUZ56_002243 [Daphnia magna]|uniref:Uncharacterized protein n=1 Tax=Daphnia magna TaxID=35525 RepID=A0ABR0A520_9CRUS|nr:hypothetical protein OUZ56_002243 [Daphnia magna]
MAKKHADRRILYQSRQESDDWLKYLSETIFLFGNKFNCKLRLELVEQRRPRAGLQVYFGLGSTQSVAWLIPSASFYFPVSKPGEAVENMAARFLVDYLSLNPWRTRQTDHSVQLLRPR